MKESDLPYVQAIENESFSDPWSMDTFLEAFDVFPETLFTAEYSDKVIGFIICGLENTGEEIYGHICNLAVDRRHQRAGIGKKLVLRCEQEFIVRCASGTQLEVRNSNINAQNFYTNLGYQPVFQIPAYYADTEDAIVMMKWFR